MTKLSDNLRAASFRGAPFHVDSSDVSIGRRGQLHEYPQRDKPYGQDLGRAAREIPITAFVVGQDYIEKANRLIDAFEEEGPGTLVHPELGSMTVTLAFNEKARVSFSASLGYASIIATFVESGELEYPTAASNTSVQSRLAAQNLEDVSIDNFAHTFSTAGMPGFVADEAKRRLGSLAGIAGGPLTGIPGYANQATRFLREASGYISNPVSLGRAIAGYLGVYTTISATTNLYRTANNLLRLAKNDNLSSPAVPASPNVSSARQQIEQNTVAINTLSRQIILTQTVGVSSLIDTTVVDDALEIRDEILSALDEESMTAAFADYFALRQAYVAVYQDITERAKDGNRLTTMAPTGILPALVIAYDLYEDALRDSEIVVRNKIRHPGFVPPRPLQVLSR